MLPAFVQKRLGVTTALVVPLACRGRFLGGLWLDDTRSPHLFTSTEINVVQGIATELANGLNTSELVGKLDLERRRFDALVGALMDGLLIVDRDRRMTTSTPERRHSSAGRIPRSAAGGCTRSSRSRKRKRTSRGRKSAAEPCRRRRCSAFGPATGCACPVPSCRSSSATRSGTSCRSSTQSAKRRARRATPSD